MEFKIFIFVIGHHVESELFLEFALRKLRFVRTSSKKVHQGPKGTNKSVVKAWMNIDFLIGMRGHE